jgi:MFS family permease
MTPYQRFLWHFFKIDLQNKDDRNAYYLVYELFWGSVLGSAATFAAAFAIRLGANNVEVGLLTSIPALMAVLVSIPAGQFLERRARRTPWIWGSLLLHRSGFLVAALVPWIHIEGVNQGLLVVIIIALNSATAHFFNVGWIPLLADVVSEERRAAVFTGRNIVYNITLSAFGFLFGQWLTAVPFPINYQSMFLIGWVASMISMVALYRIEVPDGVVKSASEQPNSLASQVRTLRDALTSHPEFMRITRNTLLHGIGIWLASPLYVLFFVRQLDATDAWLGVNGMVASLGTIVGYSFWRSLMTRWGEQPTLKRTIVLAGLYPALVGLMPGLTPILLLSALNGLVVPGINLSHFNTLLRAMPAESRPSYTAVYQTIMNTGAFVCPLIGVAIANVIGLGPALVFAGVLSIVGSSSFIWWPVVEQK